MTKLIKIFMLSMLTCSIGIAAVAQQSPTGRDFMDKVFKTASQSKAVYYRDLTPTDNGFGCSAHWVNGDLRMTGFYHEGKDGELVKHGRFVFYYNNGNVESSGYYQHGIKVGAWKRFAADGTTRTDRYYKPESADLIRDAMAGK